MFMNDQFTRIGARVRVEPMPPQRGGRPDCPMIVEVGLDDQGELFVLQLHPEMDVRIEVTSVRPEAGDLVLEAVDAGSGVRQARALCRRTGRGLRVHACERPDRERRHERWAECVDRQGLALRLALHGGSEGDAIDPAPRRSLIAHDDRAPRLGGGASITAGARAPRAGHALDGPAVLVPR